MTHNKNTHLAAAAQLKEINHMKRQLNWGEEPAFYHLVSSSVSELVNLLNLGFENAVTLLLDKNNWNLDLLNGSKNLDGEIVTESKPQVTLEQRFTERGFELQCRPVLDGLDSNLAITNHPKCPFNEWQPTHMRLLFRINQMAQFVAHTIHSGDKADMELIKFSYKESQKLIHFLSKQLDVVDIRGQSIADYYQELSKKA